MVRSNSRMLPLLTFVVLFGTGSRESSHERKRDTVAITRCEDHPRR
jgi:hypothetical protein